MRKSLLLVFLVLLLAVPLVGLRDRFYNVTNSQIVAGVADSTLMDITAVFPFYMYEGVYYTILIDASGIADDTAMVVTEIYPYVGFKSGTDSLYPAEKYPVPDSNTIVVTALTDTFLIDTLPLYGPFTVYSVISKVTIILANDTLNAMAYFTGIPRK